MNRNDNAAAPVDAAQYHIESADWRSGQVTVRHPDGHLITVTPRELEAASHDADPHIAVLYREMTTRARHEIEADRLRAVARCPRHVVHRTEYYGYTGPIPDAVENRRAHGNVCRVEYCACGAQRAANVNQTWVEQGPWS